VKVTIANQAEPQEQIKVGDVFEFDGSIFMRIEESAETCWDSIWLKDKRGQVSPGKTCSFGNFFGCTRVDAELVVTL
jgi:hypothetical protein